MGKIVFTSIAIIFIIQIIRLKGVKKLPWFFAGILFFPYAAVIIPNPPMAIPRLVTYALLFCYLFQNRQLKFNWSVFPLRRAFIFLFLCFLSIGIFDDRLTFAMRLFRPITYFLENFILIFLTFNYIKSVKDFYYVYNKLFIFFLIFALYGVMNYITKNNEFYGYIVSVYGGRNFTETYGGNRFRISSFTWHAIYYGFLLVVIMLMQIFFSGKNLKKGIQPKFLLLIGLPMLGINLLLTNSRTVLVAFLVGLAIYVAFAYSLSEKLKFVFLGLGLFIAAITFVPSASKLVDETIKTFSGGRSDFEGSSVEMRESQLTASFVVFSQSPYFGNGFKYINEGLGYSSDQEERTSDSSFEGFESYMYKLLIEQGICGIFGNILLFYGFLRWFIKKSYSPNLFIKRLSIISIAITISFLFFIFGTGDLGTFLFFMSLIGINIKTIIIVESKILPINDYSKNLSNVT